MKKIYFNQLQEGMIIRLHNNEKSDKWLVLNIGSPFVLLENLRTGFAQMHHGEVYYDTGEIHDITFTKNNNL